MSSPTKELHALISAKLAGDTASGGLNNSTGDQYVRGNILPDGTMSMWRARDTNLRSVNVPYVVASYPSINEADAFSTGKVDFTGAQFDIVTKADNRFVQQDAVVAAMRALFHQWTPGTGTQWQFNELVFRLEGPTPPNNDNEDRYTYRFIVQGIKVA